MSTQYKGYELRMKTKDCVAVYSLWQDSPVYLATSLTDARRWVRAYLRGEAWADQARLRKVAG